MLRRAGWAALLVVVCAGLAAAQGTTSRVLGQVADSSGGIIPGATITLTNEGTRATFTMTTTAAGTFAFDAVQSGTYTLKVELQGFKTFSTTGIAVQIGQPSTVNVTLQPGDISETVEVTAAALVVQTSTSGNLGTVVDQRTIESLPIVGTRGRNPLDLVTPSPASCRARTPAAGRTCTARATGRGTSRSTASTSTRRAPAARTSPRSARIPTCYQRVQGHHRQPDRRVRAEQRRPGGHGHALGDEPVPAAPRSSSARPEAERDGVGANLVCDRSGAKEQPSTRRLAASASAARSSRNKTFFFGNLQVLRATRTIELITLVYTETARRGTWRYVDRRPQPVPPACRTPRWTQRQRAARRPDRHLQRWWPTTPSASG